MENRTRIGDLDVGRYDLTLLLRRQETVRVRGEVVRCKNGEKRFVARCSPKQSFAPNTEVLQFKREVKSKKTTL